MKSVSAGAVSRSPSSSRPSRSMAPSGARTAVACLRIEEASSCAGDVTGSHTVASAIPRRARHLETRCPMSLFIWSRSVPQLPPIAYGLLYELVGQDRSVLDGRFLEEGKSADDPASGGDRPRHGEKRSER